MITKYFILALPYVFLCLNSFALNSYAPTTEKLSEKEFQIELNADYFSKTGSYDENGQEVEMLGNESFDKTDGDIAISYGFGNHLDISGGIIARQVDSGQNSNQGLESFYGGVKYVFDRLGKFTFASSAKARVTAYSNQEYTSLADVPTTEQVLGDSGSFFSILGHASYNFSKGSMFTLNLGYRATPNTLANEIPYSFETSWFSSKWALILGVDGHMSQNDDKYSGVASLKPPIASGDSAYIHGVDRSYSRVFARVNYAKRSWRLGASLGQVVSGVSADQGVNVGIHFTWSSMGVSADTKVVDAFKTYEFDASVTKVSPRGKFLKIDKGYTSGADKGIRVDIFESDYFGKNILYARGFIYEAKADHAIVKILKKFQTKRIKKGFSVKGYE